MRLRARSLASFLLFIGSAVFCVGATANADDSAAAALLAKHYAYVGWQYGDGRVPTLRLTGRTERVRKTEAPETLYDTLELYSGLINRRSLVDPKTKLAFDSGFTGNVFWSSGNNGFTVPERGDGIKDRIAFQTVFSEATTTLAGTVRKTDTIDGSPVTVVRETIPHAFPIDLYVDPTTGAYKRIAFDPDGEDYTIDIDGYIPFDKEKRAIGRWNYTGSTVFHVIDTIEAGVPVSSADLHPPAPTAQWSFGSGAAIPIELRPVDIVDRSVNSDRLRIYVKAVVDGIPGRFILDTGASSISFTRSFARKVHPTEIKKTTLRGIGGSVGGEVSHVDSIVFADGSTLKNVIVASGLVDDEERYDGLMGYDFLGGAIVALDLDAQTLRIMDPTSTLDETGGYLLLPDLTSGRPVLPVVLGATTKSTVLLDSGNPFYALLAREYVSRLRILIDRSSLASRRTIGGISGNVEHDECGALSSIALGPITYTNVPACFSNSFTNRDGLVGLDFMKHFNMTFDYPEGKIVFFPRK